MREKEYCDSCGYETDNLTTYRDYPAEEKVRLCNVCASTKAGNAQQYPNQYPNRDVLEMIAYTTNMILDEIKKLNKQ